MVFIQTELHLTVFSKVIHFVSLKMALKNKLKHLALLSYEMDEEERVEVDLTVQ